MEIEIITYRDDKETVVGALESVKRAAIESMEENSIACFGMGHRYEDFATPQQKCIDLYSYSISKTKQ